MKIHFPKPRGKRRVDDRTTVSGIVYVIRRGLHWRDAPKCYGPYQTLYNRFLRWSKAGIFEKIFQEIAAASESEMLMLGATYLRAHKTAVAATSNRRQCERHQCLLVETTLPPLELLAHTQSIEHRFDERRGPANGPRQLDIDLLLFEGVSCRSQQPFTASSSRSGTVLLARGIGRVGHSFSPEQWSSDATTLRNFHPKRLK